MSLKQIELNGVWQFSLDPNDDQKWNEKDSAIPSDVIQVPGSWEEQGYGERTAHEPIGVWKKDQEYEGVGWYVKEVEIPSTYQNKRVLLNIKGVRWFTELWIDGVYVDGGDSLSTPHEFEITSFVTAGEKHRVVIKVDNRMALELGESHIHSYNTATNWGGITGGVELTAVSKTAFDDVKIVPNTTEKSVGLLLNFAVEDESTVSDLNAYIEIRNAEGDKVVSDQVKVIHSKENAQIVTLSLGNDARFWSPTDPYLYTARLSLADQETEYDQKDISFGLRTIETEGNQILLNHQPIFLIGYVDCAVFPQTGYPVWDIEHYRKQFKIVKELGFNHVRLHGWNPPEPFWQAADEEGMLVQTELPHWSTHYMSRRRDADEAVQAFMKSELERIVKNLNAHPSFVMFSMGNELIGKDGHPQLNALVRYGRDLDNTRLYTDNTGFGQLPANDREGDFYTPTLNHHPPYTIDDSGSPDTTQDFGEITRLEQKPLIAHEHGQFTMYVRPEEAKKYQGILKPNWLETIQETLQAKGLEHRVEEFTEATGVHLVRSLKESMEKARRTPHLSGIQLLDVRDFPGQGHATVGILDVFWDSKNIVEPEAFRQFNDQTVLLMRSKKRTYYHYETLATDIEVSHFGQKLAESTLKWTLKSKNEVIEAGTVDIQEIPGDGLSQLTQIRVPLPKGNAEQLELVVELESDQGSFKNQWSFWTFPRHELPKNTNRIWTNIPSLKSTIYGARFEGTIGVERHSYKEEKNVDLAIANRMSRDVLQYIIDGGSAWLIPEQGYQHDEIITRYLPIFWNYLWFPEQTGTTMGIVNRSHPVLKNFPNDGHSDWQWYHLIDHTIALGLDMIPKVQPIVESIDNFSRAKRLAYAFEVNIGKGKLFVSTFKFADTNIMKLPEARYLFFEIINYLNSDQFKPDVTLSVGEVLGVFKIRSLIKM